MYIHRCSFFFFLGRHAWNREPWQHHWRNLCICSVSLQLLPLACEKRQEEEETWAIKVLDWMSGPVLVGLGSSFTKEPIPSLLEPKLLCDCHSLRHCLKMSLYLFCFLFPSTASRASKNWPSKSQAELGVATHTWSLSNLGGSSSTSTRASYWMAGQSGLHMELRGQRDKMKTQI